MTPKNVLNVVENLYKYEVFPLLDLRNSQDAVVNILCAELEGNDIWKREIERQIKYKLAHSFGLSSGDLTEFFRIQEEGVFDYALPQTWVDHAHKLTGIYPRNFVWLYPREEGISGMPRPLTREALDHLVKINKAMNTNYPENYTVWEL